MARAKSKPLLVLLDEAHTLEPKVGQWLLNAAQVAGRRAPFLLVLAGTPDLRARLSEMEASFWNRAEQLPLGRLDETATAEAIRRPLAEEGIAVEEEALARMVRESHGYPFFVPLWGQAVWRRVRGSAAGAVTVTAAFRDEDPLSAAAFRGAVAPGGGGAEAAEALEHLGFVWQAGGTPSWEPGIPSLMDYIVEHAPPPGEGGGAGG